MPSWDLHPSEFLMWVNFVTGSADNSIYSSRSRAELSRQLGWAPKRTKRDFVASFKEEVEAIAPEFKKV